MANEYYYLVAGLPDLVQGSLKKGVQFADILEEVRNELEEDDRDILAALQYRYDCDNILAILAKSDDFDARGFYTRSELEDEVASPEKLPQFMISFLEARKEGKEIFPGLGEKEQLLAGYFQNGLNSENEFIREWTSFELDLGNFIAGKTARALDLPVAKSVIPLNDTATRIAKSTAADFGLSSQFGWLDTLVADFGEPTKLEQVLDTIRWEKAEEISEGSYFTVEAVLAFTIKLSSAARWMALDPEHGEEKIKALLQSMQSAVSMADKN